MTTSDSDKYAPFEAIYEAELFRAKETPMWASDHEKLARRAMLDAAFAASATLPPTFTPEQVKNLDEYQRARVMHPFTCKNRGDGKHFDNGVDLGALIPTVNGWICQCCDYRQDWAHDFMLDGSAVASSPLKLATSHAAPTKEPCAICGDDPAVCATMPGNRHCGAPEVAPPPAPSSAVTIVREERRVYRKSDEYRAYLKARFGAATTENSFEWNGKRWRYEHTDFDESGDFDLLLGACQSATLPTKEDHDG